MPRAPAFPLVLDLGTHNMRLLKLRSASAGEIDLQKLAVIDSPREFAVSTYIESPIMDPQAVEEALKGLLKNVKAGFENALVLLPDHSALINLMVGPARYSRKEQEEAVKEDMTPIMPLPPELWHIVFESIGRWEEDEITLALATIKSNLLEIGGLVQKAGFNPQTVDVNFFNVSNLIEHYLTDEGNRGKNIALVHLGHETTSIGVFKDGALRSFLNRPIGSFDFTKQISKHFHVPESEAEHFKRTEIFFLPEPSPEQDETYNYTVIKSVFAALLREIFSVLEAYLTKFREFSIQEVVISGGGSNFQNISVILSSNLNAPVRQVGELYRLTTDGAEVGIPEKNALAAACGAFLRG
ncbi:MAG TPA: pilus assembly protein PilM [Candidatus Ozemobacteraceae bacterium]|nr:pilus assembly protein PilM [Candidatus Ozemobacteraceae bacterium]